VANLDLARESDAGERPNPVLPQNPLRRLYAWVLHWADTRYGTQALALIAFAESSFFPIPPDVLQIALSVSQPGRAYFFASVSLAASVVGGLLGWLIGSYAWDLVGHAFLAYVPGFTPELFEHVRALYLENAFLAIVAAAFTPIPYKIFTVASGVFGVALPVLIAASFFGRGGRFFLVATVFHFAGPTAKRLLDQYLELATISLFVLFVLGIAAISYLH
jgi:membrane protein YqaA with SNARE-associated domain